MNNEPVAWIAVGDNTSVFFDLDCALAIDSNPTPLYAHPHSDKSVKAKTLTDEEIKEAKREALKEYYNVLSYQDEFELSWIDELFARAILRKAQEK
jgi:hypothetical protein